MVSSRFSEILGSHSDIEKQANKSFLSLHKYLLKNNYCGYEYDDLLESNIVRLLTFENIYAKIVAVNISKYTGEKTRDFLKVRKRVSTKASGYISHAYLRYFQAFNDKNFAAKACRHIYWLTRCRSEGYRSSWGNNFEFASRTGLIPKFHPTVVWTSHISRSFDLAQKIFGGNFHKIVIDSGRFVKENLPILEDSDGLCFSYTPKYDNFGIHNANLLAAVCLLRAYKYNSDREFFHLAKKSIKWSCKKMRSDGSWQYSHYSELSRKRVDSYHTGYNLDCLLFAWENFGEELVSWATIEKTYKYWENNFFNSDYSPKFYPWSTYPYDIQTCAQAIETLVKFSKYNSDSFKIASGVLLWTIKNMQKSNGSFRYRIYPKWVNNLEPIHWGQATMASALANYIYNSKND